MAPTNAEFMWCVVILIVAVVAVVKAAVNASATTANKAVEAYNKALERKMHPATNEDDSYFY